jgi:hypothetical protein
VEVECRIGGLAYQASILVPLPVPSKKRSIVVFVPMLIIRYVPGWVLNGAIAEDVEVAGDIDTEEEVEAAEDEKAELVDVGTYLSVRVAESPPPRPPPIAAPNTTSTSTNAIQNVRGESPHIRGANVSGGSLMYVASLVPASGSPTLLAGLEAQLPGQTDPGCHVLARSWPAVYVKRYERLPSCET